MHVLCSWASWQIGLDNRVRAVWSYHHRHSPMAGWQITSNPYSLILIYTWKIQRDENKATRRVGTAVSINQIIYEIITSSTFAVETGIRRNRWTMTEKHAFAWIQAFPSNKRCSIMRRRKSMPWWPPWSFTAGESLFSPGWEPPYSPGFLTKTMNSGLKMSIFNPD